MYLQHFPITVVSVIMVAKPQSDATVNTFLRMSVYEYGIQHMQHGADGHSNCNLSCLPFAVLYNHDRHRCINAQNNVMIAYNWTKSSVPDGMITGFLQAVVQSEPVWPPS